MEDSELMALVYYHMGRLDEPVKKNVLELVKAVQEAERSSILDAVEVDMSLARAEELARLWAAGKMIGGDSHAVCLALLRELDRVRGA